mmetsp:Transcript_8198/g.22043  ORF Transcript_8198/g.22043 Transcript_8198/m.22043 type:complete len:262 (-) Transcript_8198:31-816(-)
MTISSSSAFASSTPQTSEKRLSLLSAVWTAEEVAPNREDTPFSSNRAPKADSARNATAKTRTVRQSCDFHPAWTTATCTGFAAVPAAARPATGAAAAMPASALAFVAAAVASKRFRTSARAIVSTRPVATNAFRYSRVKGSSKAACRAGSNASILLKAASGWVLPSSRTNAICATPSAGAASAALSKAFRRLVRKNETKGRVWGGGAGWGRIVMVCRRRGGVRVAARRARRAARRIVSYRDAMIKMNSSRSVSSQGERWTM